MEGRERGFAPRREHVWMSRRSPAREIGRLDVIEGIELPGGRCGPDLEGKWCENVQVGLAGNFILFRTAKLRLDEIDGAIVEAVSSPGPELVASIRLTDENGWPRCATVRERHLTWSVREVTTEPYE